MILSGVSTTDSGAGQQAVVDQTQLEDDLNKFLNLLLTQLQHQDPLDPMHTTEFTSQLVQFATVEQQIQQNSHLENLLAVEQNQQVAVMVNYLGKFAEAIGSAVPLENGSAEFTYSFNENAESTTITIQDATGRVVFVGEGATGAGRHKFDWNGLDTLGFPQPDGAYTVTVSAQRADGSLIDVLTTTFGRVTAAAVEENDVFLFMGDITVPMESVLSVKEPEQETDLEVEE